MDLTLADLYRWARGRGGGAPPCLLQRRQSNFDMDFLAQAFAGVVVSFALVGIVLRGTKFLVNADPTLPNVDTRGCCGNPRVRQARRHPDGRPHPAGRARLFRRDYNPATEGDTAQAVAYLATSAGGPRRAGVTCRESRRGWGMLRQRARAAAHALHTGEPPPGLYRSNRPDLLIRVAGMAVPHFIWWCRASAATRPFRISPGSSTAWP